MTLPPGGKQALLYLRLFVRKDIPFPLFSTDIHPKLYFRESKKGSGTL